MTVQPTRRAAIYGRFSSTMQSSHSTDDQLALGRGCADRAGFVVVGLYGDQAKSGRARKNRSGFLDLERDAKLRKFDVIIVEDVDRIGCNAAQAIAFQNLIDIHGIEIHGLAGPIDRLLFQMKAVLAEHQSRETGTRVRQRQHARLKATGAVMAGLAYGYAPAVTDDGCNRTIVEGRRRLGRCASSTRISGTPSRRGSQRQASRSPAMTAATR